MTVYTGGSASVMYGVESTFNTAASAITNIFGVQQKVSSFSLSNNRIDLNKLGQVETACYAYGQQAGSLSVGFIFDNGNSHKIFQAIYGAPAGSGTVASPFLYPATLAQGATAPTVTSLTTNINLQTGLNTLKRSLTGCIVNSLNISTSIGETLNGSVDMTFAKENNSAVLTSTDTITQQDAGTVDQGTKPYTFAHGEVKISTGTALNSTAIADVQDIDLTFAQNTEMLYGLGSNYSVGAYRRVLDVTGRFRAVWKDATIIQHVIDQVRDSEEMLDYTSGVGMQLTFTNGTKLIKIELDDLGIADHGVSGIEPVEPVFEEINWKAKVARISVTNAA